MTNLKKRMLKASVTLGLVFGAALFAVNLNVLNPLKAASILDIPADAWTKSNSGLPEPGVNADGFPSYEPFETGDVNLGNSNIMGMATASIIDALPTSANQFGLGIKFNSGIAMPIAGKVYMNQSLDLTKKFTHKANLYFGGSEVTTNGDGLSFLLAKDLNSSFDNGYVLPGSSLGVWGQPTNAPIPDGQVGTSITPDKSAVPNSFAIVMDTKKDTGYSSANGYYSSMDDQVNYNGQNQYVGYGYPGKSEMYEQVSTSKDTYKTKGQYYVLKYKNTSDTSYINGGNADAVNGTLSTGQWHPFEVDWVPDGTGGGKLTYTLKIRGSNGEIKQTISRTVTWSKADIDDIFGAGTTSLRWGYVSSAYGSSNETHAVSFASMGDVSVSLDASLVSKDGTTPVTITQKGETYTQLSHINMKDSSTDWPDSGKLSAVIQTNKNYEFVKKSDGDVDVIIAGKTYPGKIDANNPQKLTVDGIDAISVASAKANNEVRVEVKAVDTDDSLTSDITTLRMGGGSTIREAHLSLPVPQAQQVHNILIPSFAFGSYGITRYMTGFTAEGTATTNSDNQIAVTTDGSTGKVALTVALNTVKDFASEYNGGHLHLAFTFAGQNISLTDGGTPQLVFSQSTIPDTSLGDETPSLRIDPTPNVTAGAKNASLVWTVQVNPNTDAAN